MCLHWSHKYGNDKGASKTFSRDVHEPILDYIVQNWTTLYRRCNYQVHFDQVNFTISDYVMRHLTGLFCVCYGKWCKDVQIWYEKDGNSSEKQGNVPTRVPWSKVDENSEKIVLRRQEWGLFVLTIFHRWLHYTKIVSRVMWIVEWRHERRIHCVLA